MAETSSTSDLKLGVNGFGRIGKLTVWHHVARKYFKEIVVNIGRQAEEILVLEPHRMLVDEDSVAVVGFMKCRVIATGKTYESDFVHLVTLSDGKVAKFQEFFDTYAAGEAFR